jgi:hypothetical protein
MKSYTLPRPISDMYGGYLLLNLFDLGLTALILTLGGKETNPFAAYLLYNHGTEALILGKLFIVAFTILIFEWIRALSPLAAHRTIRLGLFVYYALVLWECEQLIVKAHLPGG